MSKPIIVVTTSRLLRSAAKDEHQSVILGVESAYVDAIVHARGAPALLPPHADQEAVRALVEAADGLLLTGGGDIASLAYGREPNTALYGTDPTRDKTEIDAVRIAIGRDIPVLGICRGLQLINVALGGTLIQDIGSEIGSEIQHGGHHCAVRALHTIDIEPDSILGKLHNAVLLQVNTSHHQAVEQLGDGLKVVARARDAVVEAVEFCDGKPLLAVQYHPEELEASDTRFRLYFNWLVSNASAYLARKTPPAKPSNGKVGASRN